MADDFNFNFDDSDGFDIGDSSQNYQGDLGIGDPNNQSGSDNEFGDFMQDSGDDIQRVDEPTQDKSTVIKTAAILIVVAIMLIAIVFKFIGGSGKHKDSDTKSDGTQQVEQINNSNSNEGTNSNNWILTDVAKDAVQFNDDTVKSRFQITGIKHYAKTVDGNNNLAMKTVLVGTLDGINGTFEMEVAYSRGRHLKLGMDFPVRVEMGSYNGKSVVGEIFIGE